MVRFGVVGLVLIGLSACNTNYTLSSEERLIKVEQGREIFSENCAVCHADTLLGTEKGPPLISNLYVSNHHSDRQFRVAVSEGVKQHHWYFGDMPPIPSLSDDEVDDVIFYVRSILKENGIR